MTGSVRTDIGIEIAPERLNAISELFAKESHHFTLVNDFIGVLKKAQSIDKRIAELGVSELGDNDFDSLLRRLEEWKEDHIEDRQLVVNFLGEDDGLIIPVKVHHVEPRLAAVTEMMVSTLIPWRNIVVLTASSEYVDQDERTVLSVGFLLGHEGAISEVHYSYDLGWEVTDLTTNEEVYTELLMRVGNRRVSA